MNFMRLFVMVCAASAVTGCAHPISVKPDASKITSDAGGQPKIHATVGYYISPESLAREVTTDGGGGDRTRYFPYRDIQSSFEKMLSNVFDGVSRLDAPGVSKGGIQYVISPDIVTTSGSTSFLTWPPTNFTVDLTSNVRDASGKLVASPRVVGNGQAEFSDFKSNHGLAGQLAMADALTKMQRSLSETSFSGSDASIAPAPKSTIPTPPARGGASDRLAELKRLRDGGLISEADYESKKKHILDAM